MGNSIPRRKDVVDIKVKCLVSKRLVSKHIIHSRRRKDKHCLHPLIIIHDSIITNHVFEEFSL